MGESCFPDEEQLLLDVHLAELPQDLLLALLLLLPLELPLPMVNTCLWELEFVLESLFSLNTTKLSLQLKFQSMEFLEPNKNELSLLSSLMEFNVDCSEKSSNDSKDEDTNSLD